MDEHSDRSGYEIGRGPSILHLFADTTPARQEVVLLTEQQLMMDRGSVKIGSGSGSFVGVLIFLDHRVAPLSAIKLFSVVRNRLRALVTFPILSIHSAPR